MRRSAVACGSLLGLASLVLPLATACTPDQGLTPFDLDAVAVVTGDFDRVEAVFDRLAAPATLYEGYIVGPTTDVELDPLTPPVESLLQGDDPTLGNHDAVLLNSGVRGLGDRVYNGLDPDDHFVSDDATLAALVAWVETGGVLVASDWAYDVIEEGWPDAVTFARESEGLDAAQVGLSEQVSAVVADPAVEAALGSATVGLSFDYTYWAVMTSVADDVTVHLRGDVQFRVDEEDGSANLPDVPLLVSFTAGRGRVVLSSFHWQAQNAAVADALLPTVVEGLPLGESLQ